MHYVYLRRRIAVAALLFIAFIPVAKVVFQDPPARCNHALHVVTSGETIWSIAHANCTSGIITAIDQLVGQYGSSIDVGDRIQLP
jgi:ABC-type sulfate transport system permease component